MAKSKIETSEYVNPLKEGVTYKEFVEALGNSSVSDYCKDLDADTIEWLKTEIENYKNNTKK